MLEPFRKAEIMCPESAAGVPVGGSPILPRGRGRQEDGLDPGIASFGVIHKELP